MCAREQIYRAYSWFFVCQYNIFNMCIRGRVPMCIKVLKIHSIGETFGEMICEFAAISCCVCVCLFAIARSLYICANINEWIWFEHCTRSQNEQQIPSFIHWQKKKIKQMYCIYIFVRFKCVFVHSFKRASVEAEAYYRI